MGRAVRKRFYLETTPHDHLSRMTNWTPPAKSRPPRMQPIPDPTFADLEDVVEVQIEQLRNEPRAGTDGRGTGGVRPGLSPVWHHTGVAQTLSPNGDPAGRGRGDGGAHLCHLAGLCSRAFYPLDNRLGLLLGQLSPRFVQTILRPVVLPFEQVLDLLALLCGVHVSPNTVRRICRRW